MGDMCLLCLQAKQESTDLESIAVASDCWRDNKIEEIIEKHFWSLKTITSNAWLCLTCWEVLNEFHKFYIRIEDAHVYCASMLKTELVEGDENMTIATSSLPKGLPDNQLEKELTIQFVEQEEPIIIKTELLDEDQFMSDDIALASKCKEKSEDPLEKTSFIRSKKVRQLRKSRKQKIRDDSNQDTQKSPSKGDVSESCDTISRVNSGDSDDDIRNSSDSENESDVGGKKAIAHKRPRAKNNELNAFLAENFKITCAICQESMDTFLELCRHFAKCHNERGYAMCCSKKFFTRRNLVDHIHWHVNPDDLKCKHCGKLLADRRCLDAHVKTHEIQEKSHICDICGKAFGFRNGLRNHKLIHLSDEEKKFPCEQCGKPFGNNNLLLNHVRVVHQNKYALVCEMCGKKMRTKEAFERHMLLHNGIAPPTIQCDVCGLKVTERRGLKRHKETQHPEGGKKDYPCLQCSVVSPTLRALKKHVKYQHETGYDFKCTICDKAFKRSTYLTEHMASHTGTTLYTCSYCPKTFNSNSNMHNHRKKVHPKEWEQALREKYSGNLPPNYTPAVTTVDQCSASIMH